MTTDKLTDEWLQREQAALRWMYAGVEAGEEPQSTLAAMFQERANAEGRMADEYMQCRRQTRRAEKLVQKLAAAAGHVMANARGPEKRGRSLYFRVNSAPMNQLRCALGAYFTRDYLVRQKSDDDAD